MGLESKQKNVTADMLTDKHAGDVWTWTVLDDRIA